MIVCLSAAQLVGTPTLIAAIEMEVGTPDSYGDYPAARATALVITATLTILGLVMLSMRVDAPRSERLSAERLWAAL